VGDYKKLRVWRKSHEVTLAIYEATAKFPSDERYGLKSQLRRAASSVPANLAEGCGLEVQEMLVGLRQSLKPMDRS